MGGTDTLVLPAQLTLPEARAALAELEAVIARAVGPVTVDASALTGIDSSTLAVLLQCQRCARARQLGFSVRGAPPRLADLARLYGVDALIAWQ